MQNSAEFTPQSWEMPPGFRVVERSAQTVARDFGGERLMWGIALVEVPALSGCLMWLRPLDLRFDAGFTVTSPPSYDGIHRYRVPTFNQNMETGSLRASLTMVWRNEQFARRFFLGEQGDLRRADEPARESFLVRHDGRAAWSLAPDVANADGALREIAPPHFRWSSQKSATEFLHLSAAELWRDLQTELADPQTQAAFARRFARLNRAKRRELVLVQTRARQNELQMLLRARTRLIENVDKWPQGMGLQIRYNEERGSFVCHNPFFNVMENSADLVADVELLVNSFCRIKAEFLRYACVVSWLRDSPFYEVPFSAPTAHERLEAHLLWRDWLASIENVGFAQH